MCRARPDWLRPWGLRPRPLWDQGPGGLSASRQGVGPRASLLITGGGGLPCSRSGSSVSLGARCVPCRTQTCTWPWSAGIGRLGEPGSRDDVVQQMDTAVLEWQENGISESWAEAWPQLPRAQQLVALIRADFSLGNHHLWGLVSTTLRAAWEQMASAVNDQMDT